MCDERGQLRAENLDASGSGAKPATLPEPGEGVMGNARRTGIEVMREAPWGSHFCQFYASKEDLAEILLPYFKAGLEDGEFCMWITTAPLEKDEAWEALGAVMPDLEEYRRQGRIEILAHTEWYVVDGVFDQDRVLQGWIDKLEAAVARGCKGLRLSGNTFWLERSDWKGFSDYEAAVDDVIGRFPILALCTYSLERCGASEIADVIKNHQFALLKRDGVWEQIESFDRRRLEELHTRHLAFEREQALKRGMKRFELLAGTAGELLRSREPQKVIDSLCSRVMAHLDCRVFLNFLTDDAGQVRLNASSGIPESHRDSPVVQEFGQRVCEAAARDGRDIIVVESGATQAGAGLMTTLGVRTCATHPLLGSDGEVMGSLSFARRAPETFTSTDLSLMKAVADQVSVAMVRLRDELQLRANAESLREVDRRKNDFLALLSHELRNPLAPISNSLFVLERAAPGSDQSHRARQIISRQVAQLTRLVDDLLDVTRVSRNKILLQRSRLDLCELVRRAVEDHASLFAKVGVQLELVGPGVPLLVDGDWNRLSQVVGNLLQNAAKFTAPGGVARVEVASEAHDGNVMLSIRDTGVGMGPDTLSRLFQPFMQADITLDRSNGGLGLGLALVKGLVELHGGRIEARSAGPGTGSQFIVRLPLRLEAGADAAGVNPCRRCRVLIIEDHDDAAETLRSALLAENHEVDVARDGLSGLSRAREFRPEIVLCDISLPGMSGYEVARALRADPTLAPVYLVALSGYSQVDEGNRAKAAGFDAHLAKPLHLDVLDAVISQAPLLHS